MVPGRGRSRGRLGALLLCAAAAGGLGGCRQGGPALFPVEGKVLLDGKPLRVDGTKGRTGYVVFYPDAARGNPSREEPRGEIDAEGNYRVLTGLRPGAPPGWYKVTVGVTEQPNPNDAYTFTWLVPQDYVDKDRSKLALEVVEKPEPGAYDLQLHSKPR
jgi:hypothetical protein